MTALIISIVVVVVVGLYLVPNDTKAVLEWTGKGVAGAARDAKAIRAKAKKQALENPNIVKENVGKLNASLGNTTVYYHEAGKRWTKAEREYQEAVEKLESRVANRQQ